MTSNIDTILKKILSTEELPTQSECIKAMKHMEKKEKSAWWEFCLYNGVYTVVNDKLIDGIYDIILKSGATNVVEVCAGKGKLAYWLNKRGLNIKTTDSYSPEWNHFQRPNFVERIEHSQALEKYNPDFVIACFPDESSTVPIDILAHPSVKNYIHLGNAERSPDKCWKERIEQMKNVAGIDLDKLNTFPTFDDSSDCDRSSNGLYEKLEAEK